MTAVADLGNGIGRHKSYVRRAIGVRGVAVDAVGGSGIDRLPALQELMIVAIVPAAAAHLNGVLDRAGRRTSSARQYFRVTL